MGTLNTMGDLHNLLMEQMERLRDASPEELPTEVSRSAAIGNISEKLISNAKVCVEVVKLKQDTWNGESPEVPRFLDCRRE